jgi:SAM-dependent methyltransferase
VTYVDEFDYIICTGVVHHNANPEATLARISRALKKDGIFEFMVYNYYHRLMTTACQKAIRCFYNSGSSLNLELELTLIKNLMSDFHYPGLISEFLKAHMDIPEAQMVDNLIQPVEYSYTVESLGTMMDNCNLGYLHHCQNQFDVFNNAFTWNMEFRDDFMREHYYSLPDARRWQVANLLLLNNSPMLWFYVQRKDSGIERKSEQQLCEEFLETKFQRNAHQLRNYVLSDDGTYKLSETPVKQSIENSIVDPKLRMIYKTISPNIKMKEVLHQLNIKPDFFETNTLRIKLTTSGYPHLVAVH